MTFLVLAPSVPGVCLDGVPALWSSTDVPRCGRGGSTVPRPPICSLLPSLAPFAPVAWVMGGVSSPPCLHLSLLGSPLPAVVAPGVLPPWVNSATLGVSVPCGDSTPPPTLRKDPRGFPPLWRPHRIPPCPPLRGTRLPLRRSCVPRPRPALPSFCRPIFLACLRTSPFAPASPHGGPMPVYFVFIFVFVFVFVV